jgi:hypothetical protein
MKRECRQAAQGSSTFSTVLALNLWMKSAAFCACAAAVKIARLSFSRISSQLAVQHDLEF